MLLIIIVTRLISVLLHTVSQTTGFIAHFPTLDPGCHDFEAMVIQMVPRVIKGFVTSLRQSFLHVPGLGRQYRRQNIDEQ